MLLYNIKKISFCFCQRYSPNAGSDLIFLLMEVLKCLPVPNPFNDA